MTAFDFRPTLNAPDDDPYLWLEDIEGERSLDWTASQSARTLATSVERGSSATARP